MSPADGQGPESGGHGLSAGATPGPAGPRLQLEGRTAVLHLRADLATPDVPGISEQVRTLVEQALAQGVDRIETRVPTDHPAVLRALHRAGFRREGLLRRADQGRDVFMMARLADDVVGGPNGFSSVMDTVLPRTRLIAHVLFTDASGRVLLLQTTYKPDLELPGGVVEPLEDPATGAIREVAEEIGLQIDLGDPVLVDWMPPSLGWSDAVEFLFDAGQLTDDQIDAISPEPGEIAQVRWVEPGDLEPLVSPLSARRLTLLLQRRDQVETTGHGVATSGQGPVLFTRDGRLRTTPR